MEGIIKHNSKEELIKHIMGWTFSKGCQRFRICCKIKQIVFLLARCGDSANREEESLASFCTSLLYFSFSLTNDCSIHQYKPEQRLPVINQQKALR